MIDPETGGHLWADRFDRRWELFDKTPRIASHSHDGVMELMPTNDWRLYGFKYVNGHPKNMRRGLQTVPTLGVLAVGSGYPMLPTEMIIPTAAHHQYVRYGMIIT